MAVSTNKYKSEKVGKKTITAYQKRYENYSGKNSEVTQILLTLTFQSFLVFSELKCVHLSNINKNKI